MITKRLAITIGILNEKHNCMSHFPLDKGLVSFPNVINILSYSNLKALAIFLEDTSAHLFPATAL